MAYAGYAMFLISSKGDSFGLYLNRTLTARDDIGERFNSQGILAFTKGLEVSQGWGLGVGAGANLGNLQLSAAAQAQRASIRSLSYVSEGGGGKIITELGLPGLVVGGTVAGLIALSLWRNFKMLQRLPSTVAFLMLGLIAFAMANVVFFFSAAQVYTDPFVLILVFISFGSFLAVPTLIARQQIQWQQSALQQSQQAAANLVR